MTRYASVVLLTGVLAACADAVAPAAPARLAPLVMPAGDLFTQVVPNEYLVILDDRGSDVVATASAAEAHGALVTARWDQAIHGFAVRGGPETIRALRLDPRVRYVEVNGRVTISAATTATSWGLDRIDQASLPLDLTFTAPNSGAGVHVYVIDTGIRLTHTQFTGRMGAGFDAITPGGTADDCHGHGTHVAGTAGGSTFGVARQVTLHAVRVIDCTGNGTDAQVISGINWVAANRISPAVANMSIGGPYSAAINQATTALVAAGVTTAVASGNSARDACTESPASTPSAITVNALNIYGNHTVYSNYGPCTDVYAPGTNIVSAWSWSDTATAVSTGTSMASPHVAGAAALYLSANRGASPAQVEAALLSLAATGKVGKLPPNTPDRLINVQGIPVAPTPATNLPPVASFTVTCVTTISPHKCTLDAAPSSDDGGFGSLKFSWTNTGGRPAKSGNPISYSYWGGGALNTFAVTLTATDAGNLSHSVTKTVVIP